MVRSFKNFLFLKNRSSIWCESVIGIGVMLKNSIDVITMLLEIYLNNLDFGSKVDISKLHY